MYMQDICNWQISFSSVPWNLVDVNIKIVNKTFSKKKQVSKYLFI